MHRKSISQASARLKGALFTLAIVTALPVAAQSEKAGLSLELNSVVQAEGACRVTFLAQNASGADIEQAVFETVIFTKAGEVERLTLFDMRELPAGRPRVRQFDLAGLQCDDLGQVLINGANTCKIAGAPSPICGKDLHLGSRVDVELLG